MEKSPDDEGAGTNKNLLYQYSNRSLRYCWLTVDTMKASARLDAFLPEMLNTHYPQAIKQIKSYAASKTLSPAVGMVGMLGRG